MQEQVLLRRWSTWIFSMEEHGSNYGHREHCYSVLTWSADSRHAILTKYFQREHWQCSEAEYWHSAPIRSTEGNATNGVLTQCSNTECWVFDNRSVDTVLSQNVLVLRPPECWHIALIRSTESAPTTRLLTQCSNTEYWECSDNRSVDAVL